MGSDAAKWRINRLLLQTDEASASNEIISFHKNVTFDERRLNAIRLFIEFEN